MIGARYADDAQGPTFRDRDEYILQRFAEARGERRGLIGEAWEDGLWVEGREDDGGARAGGLGGFEFFEGAGAGDFEVGAASGLGVRPGHGGAGVDDDDDVFALGGVDVGVRGCGPDGSVEGEGDERDDEDAEEKEEEIARAFAGGLFGGGDLDEADGGEVEGGAATTGEEVGDDGEGGCGGCAAEPERGDPRNDCDGGHFT